MSEARRNGVATLMPKDSCLVKAVYKILISDIFRVSALVSPISRSTVFYQFAAVHYSIELTDILSSRLCTLLKLTYTCIMCKLKMALELSSDQHALHIQSIRTSLA